MKNWTKILIAVLSLVMILSLTGCPGEPEETPAPESSSNAPASSDKPADSSDKPADSESEPADSSDEPADSSDEPVTPPAPSKTFEDAMKELVTGEILSAKAVYWNEFDGKAGWVLAEDEAYLIAAKGADAALKIDVMVESDAVITIPAKVAGGTLVIKVNDMALSGDLADGEHTVKVKLWQGKNTIVLSYTGTGEALVGATTVAAAAIAIDAVKDDKYASATEFTIGDAWSNNPSDYTLTGGKAWVVYDGTGIYVYGEVQDATPFGDTDGNVDNGDKFQLYIDAARDSAAIGKVEGAYKQTGTNGSTRLGWFNATPDGKCGGAWGFGGITGQAVTKEIEGGYAVEMYVPIVGSLVKDNTIGLSICIHDDIDGNANRDAIFFTTGGTDYWNSYEKIPSIQLVVVE